MVSPFDAQASRWTAEYQARHARLFSEADITTATGHVYDRGCMFRRNRYLVDNADYVLCHTQADSGMSLKGIDLAKERNKTIVEWK